MNGLAKQRMVLSTALRKAIANDTLKLHYQPQIRTVDGAIHGVEALARWHDPALGEISPAKFIPLAEECGLIEQIGLWSIREACRQMAQWRASGLDIPSVSVNLSPINFQNENLAASVAEILADYALPPEALMLEITEGVILNERSVAIETMNAVRRLGVGLSLDDFGTGYSSLSRLTQLPIRELKIDRSFMRDIERDPDRHHRGSRWPELAARRRRRRRRNRWAAEFAHRAWMRRGSGFPLRARAVTRRIRPLAART
jgi:EAL domain-containing protein (putative c-di-GMP-specific phosphodiesterase class I)